MASNIFALKRVNRGITLILSAFKTIVVRNDTRRWRKVADSAPAWSERNKLIASFIAPGSSVLDLGAGSRDLRKFLDSASTYQPCDLVPSPGVILCDFNSDKYPDLAISYDVVVCSGVFEYIRNPTSFLDKIRNFGSRIVFSYNPVSENSSIAKRLANGWVNHLSRQALENLFAANSYSYVLLNRNNTTDELIYELSSTSRK